MDCSGERERISVAGDTSIKEQMHSKSTLTSTYQDFNNDIHRNAISKTMSSRISIDSLDDGLPLEGTTTGIGDDDTAQEEHVISSGSEISTVSELNAEHLDGTMILLDNFSSCIF